MLTWVVGMAAVVTMPPPPPSLVIVHRPCGGETSLPEPSACCQRLAIPIQNQTCPPKSETSFKSVGFKGRSRNLCTDSVPACQAKARTPGPTPPARASHAGGRVPTTYAVTCALPGSTRARSQGPKQGQGLNPGTPGIWGVDIAIHVLAVVANAHVQNLTLYFI